MYFPHRFILMKWNENRDKNNTAEFMYTLERIHTQTQGKDQPTTLQFQFQTKKTIREHFVIKEHLRFVI